MKKIIILVSIMVLLSGCTASKINLDEINNNLSSSNPSVVGGFVSGIYNDGLEKFGITGDIVENDNIDTTEEVLAYKEWLLPQYDKMIQELASVKYQKIDDINDDTDMLMMLENKESGYKLYIYKDNRIKVVGEDSVCYQSEKPLEYTNSLVSDFATKMNEFVDKIQSDSTNQELIAQMNEAAPICDNDKTKTVYFEEKVGNPYSLSEGCRHHTFGTDKVWYQDYICFYQCPECGTKLNEENTKVEVDMECFGH